MVLNESSVHHLASDKGTWPVTKEGMPLFPPHQCFLLALKLEE